MEPEKLSNLLCWIDDLSPRHLTLGKVMLESDYGRIYGMDLYTLGALNRSLDHIGGFGAALKNGSWLSAGALVRIQFDTAMRYFAAFLVDDPHQFAVEVLSGTMVRDIPDKTGRKMTDRYLSRKIGEKYRWFPDSYDRMSGYVHMSDIHMLAPIQASGDKTARTIGFEIGKMENCVSDRIYNSLTTTFKISTEIFLDLVEDWATTK